MKSYRIIRHSLRQLFGNFSAALTISGPLYVAMSVIVFALLSMLSAPVDPDQMTLDQAIGGIATVLCGAVFLTWIAVGWHRYVLLEEPARPVPQWRPDRMLSYVGRSIQLGLCLVVLLVPVIFLIGMIGILAPFLLALIGAVALRLTVMLPAAAVKQGFGPVAAFRYTEGTMGTMLLLSLMTGLLQAIVNLATMQMGGVIGIALSIIGNWLLLMFTASVATTLYGHYVEGRELL